MTDIKMPGMSGLDLIGKVCTNTDLTIEFILLSGYADFEYAKQAIIYKVSNYLLKPCNESQIIDAIKKASGEIRRSFFLCAEHGTNLTGESPVTGIYRQV